MGRTTQRGTGQPLCAAPAASMYLDPAGDVRACCQNRWHRLGNVSESGLIDIWRGTAARELRERMLDHDLTLGCELCAAEVRDGSGDKAFFRQFDDLRVDDALDPPWPVQLELALSISCNLQCTMCNGELSSAIRVHREGRPALVSPYGDRFFRELDSFLPHLRRVMFLGGEPFLGREPLRVMDRLIELGLTPYCSITTNGTQWNDRVRRALSSLPLDVLVSVDGCSDEVIRSIRVGTDRATLVENLGRYLDAVRAAGNRLRLTFSLMDANWHELGQVLAWADDLDVDVQVNDVTHPPRLSLLHAPLDRLEHVVGELVAEDRVRAASLGRNLQVWRREVDRLRSVLEARRRAPADDVAGSGTSARQLATDLGHGGQVHEVVVDRSNVIVSIRPAARDVFGVDVSNCVGRSAATLLDTIMGRLGRLRASDLRFTVDGVEQREFVLSGGGSPRRIVATMSATEVGETWYLTESDGAPRPSPVVLRARHG